jgi:FdhD protein
MYKKEYETVEIINSNARLSSFTAAVEETVELYVNNVWIASILTSPGKLEQLAIGYLVCEGIVSAPPNILDVMIGGKNRIFTEITKNDHFNMGFEIRSSGCISVNRKNNEDVKVESDSHFHHDAIQGSLHYLESEIYRETRGTHAACIINRQGGCIACAIDVGRHNAVDKAIGQAIMDGFNPGEHFILSTGRQPAGMVMKAARAGIPMVVTKAAPLNSGIETAKRTDICLVGFASPNSMTVFSNEWRIDGCLTRINY